MTQPRELSASSISLGLIIGVVMTAANVYLGLYAGMTVSASIPAAVIGLAVYRSLFKKHNIHEVNIIQTMASAGESLAAGVIFTLPALVIVGAWQDFQFWPTTLIAISGGVLGVLFMIPLRKVLIVDDPDLIYPEGVACAQVLESGGEGTGGAFEVILKGLGIGFVFKFLSSGLKAMAASVELAFGVGGRPLFMGSDMSPALLAVGYIVNLHIAVLVFIGGAGAWLIALPMLAEPSSSGWLDLAWTTWSTKVRYLGVGAMLTGGVWSIISVRKGIGRGLKDLLSRSPDKGVDEANLGIGPIATIMMLNLALVFFVYKSMIGSMGMTLLTTGLMAVLSFLFVAVSSYIVGLVGSSNNPVSGMTICALLVAASLFLVFGYEGQSAILMTLGVAAVVCCAACTSADCSQDLKTGSLIKATPRSQQIAQLLGICIPAFVIAPVLTLLHNAFGIGTGGAESLKAPQASLFASIVQGLFGQGQLETELVMIGVFIGLLILVLDAIQAKRKGFRFHLMPIAVGIYLPVTLALPMLVGGLVRFLSEKKKESSSEAEDKGLLLSSGLIAGEALTGVLLAVIVSAGFSISLDLSTTIREVLAVLGFVALTLYLAKQAAKDSAS